MLHPNYLDFLSIDCKKIGRFTLRLIFLCCFCLSNAQIYNHNFGTATISAHPYTVAPAVIQPNLSGSSWTNSAGVWTSTAGATGEAIRLTTATNATITLTFNVAANFQVDITSFDFWRMRSNLGPQNWSMTINGISAGSGTTGIVGAAIGTTPVSSTVSGLTGTVTVVLSLTGSTGNGTFRLDDFILNGTVTSNCTGSTISSILPVSGPQNTLVTINGSGFQSGSGTSSVLFNGIPASSFTVVSDNLITAYVPAGNASGPMSVITNACESFAPVNFTKLVSVAPPSYSSDIYISEIYDAQAGDGGVIEIYNGTANPINLSGYTIIRYGDIGGPPGYTINLTGTIPAGGVFLVGIGTGITPCAITESQHYSTGFNSNDEFELYNNGTLIDNVHAPLGVGYSVIRNPTAIAPAPAFNSADWNTFTTESCANIGINNVPVNTAPAIVSPVSTSGCSGNSVVFNASIANPAGYVFQWKMLNAAGLWINVPNTAPYLGSNTNTLTVNPLSPGLNDSQFYCQATLGGTVVVSNAAQLEVTPLIVPDFATTLSLCAGDPAPVLATTSPNGISGTWNPATISNTTSGNYVFTPSAGQCATTATLVLTIANPTTPNFATALSLCAGDPAPVLAATSPNGISGTWNPATISNTTSGNYVFTPSAGQCSTTATLVVTITNSTIPNFATALSLCAGDPAPVLAATSPNGISGTWNPATISNTTSGNYVFTPSAGQCSTTATLVVTITNGTTPNFATALSLCAGDPAPALAATSPNGISGTWNPATISNTTSGNYVFTPNSGQCATTATLVVTITNPTTPNFATALSLCAGDPAPVLATTSPNGISGTWNPATISNTTSGNYVFTPNAGQCATTATLVVTITNPTTPNFATTLSLCAGDPAPALAATSPNGISGTWNPATISNTTSGNYVFTPNAGQCATTATLVVTITNPTTPNFATALSLCAGDPAPVLATTSPNGISGTWNPATISNTTSGNYVFTPNAGQCATTATLVVTITNPTTPNFATTLSLCAGDPAPALAATSPNGISGTWNPATISNTTSGNYVFTPNAGQCATTATLVVTITNPTTPNFATALSLCAGDPAPALAVTSPNGISGTWNPATISNTTSGNYVFTPNAGQCATTATLVVTITNPTTPNFATALSLCAGDPAPALAATSPNGISGTWNPATISNTISGNYVFAPNAGQCATTATLVVTITNPTTPNFATALSLCAGDPAPVLAATSPNGISGTWVPSTISNTTSGNYVFTPNAGQCATTATLVVTITNPTTPNFATALSLCPGDPAPALAATSPNGISGTWNPATISNTTSGNYVFTPNAGQCATSATLVVTITNGTTPNFATALSLCAGDPAPALAATSPNGISGTWNPATISNTTSGNYVFTPNAGQCATSATLVVTITNGTTPNFATALSLCAGDPAPVLATTSPNGVSGTWNPATISNTTSGNYVFTPSVGQCATTATLVLTIANPTTPNFATALSLCAGDPAPVLAATSPNGISGTWNPATISNTTSGNYVFTPSAGQCSTTATLVVTITNSTVPNFATALSLCAGDPVPALAPTSPNGISGTWIPSTISNTTSGNYVFTPSVGQCATTATLVVTIANLTTPNFATALSLCAGDPAPVLATTSPNGISGTWIPSTISNTTSGNYVFTPSAGQCVTTATLVVTITNGTTPNFATTLSLCAGDPAPALAATSPNGISGTWNPATISNTTSGNYVFTPSAGQCATTATLNVTINQLPQPVLQDGFICIGAVGQSINPAILSTGLPNNGYTFVWTWNGNPLITIINTHLATDAGLYEVTVTNSATGCISSAQATVTVLTAFTAQVVTDDDFNNDGTITIVTSGGSGSFEYQLDDDSPQTGNRFFNVASGSHTVFVTDSNGCASYTFPVFLLDYPRFFTPNGDGYNDFWNIGGLSEQPSSKIYLFDRYGKLIKSLKPSDQSGWDGTFNGRELPGTDYWFELFYKDRNGQDRTFSSHFSLKR